MPADAAPCDVKLAAASVLERSAPSGWSRPTGALTTWALICDGCTRRA